MAVRAPGNRSLALADTELPVFQPRLLALDGPVAVGEVLDRTICGDVTQIAPWLPRACVDLLFVDPPYNLNKSFRSTAYRARGLDEYEWWLESWFVPLLATLKPTASVYVCGDWRSSSAIHRVADRHLIVRNRITWEREKGRGAARNWKNCAEDIWFCTVSDDYWFDIEAVKLRRTVMAPYTDGQGHPRDWSRDETGSGTRLTCPSNMWTDLTVPFWSMPENTEHPTQKPEKLLAKITLASSRPGDLLLDPFLGSGTTAVVARKLGRHCIGVERDPHYCCLAEKRLASAAEGDRIQGYEDGVFWERNARRRAPLPQSCPPSDGGDEQ